MVENTRGEQRFASVTYSELSRWTGLKLSTVQSYGSHGHIPKENLVATLQWVARYCENQKRPGPWEMYLDQQDRFSRELGFWCYKDYLKSDLWQEIRSRILPAKCRRCGQDADCVHHQRYTLDNMRGKDSKYLVPLCNLCHMKSRHPDFQDSPTSETNNQQRTINEDSPAPTGPSPSHPPSCRCHECYQATKTKHA